MTTGRGRRHIWDSNMIGLNFSVHELLRKFEEVLKELLFFTA